MSHDIRRGARIRHALKKSKIVKAHALAAELNVSVAAVSKWQNGGHISRQSACDLAQALDTSLDWLLLGRCSYDWHKYSKLSPTEIQWITSMRNKPESIHQLVTGLLNVLPQTAH